MAARISRRIRQRVYSAAEVAEIISGAGSDDEEDVVRPFEFDEDENDDLEEDFVPSDGDNSSDSGDEEIENRPLPADRVNNVPRQNVEERMDVGGETSDEEELEGTLDGDYINNWSQNLTDFPSPFRFNVTPGLQGPLKLPAWEACKPVDLYRLFICDEIIKLMKTETNRYARQVITQKQRNGTPISARSMYSKWKPVTKREMTDFLAILIHMGVVHKPRIVDYWSTNPVLHSPFASSLMKRDRFRAILAFYHLNNNDTFVPRGQPNHDPLHKLRPLFDHLAHVSIYFCFHMHLIFFFYFANNIFENKILK